MFEIEWQTAIALTIVASAIGYLCLRLFGFSVKRNSGCGGCGTGSTSDCSKDVGGLQQRELFQLGSSDSDKTGD